MSGIDAISVVNISKIYNIYQRPFDMLLESIFRKSHHQEFSSLKNVSFTVKKGNITGIVGRNGAGKSTLLKIITGTLAPSSGVVHVNGRIAAILELGTGFHPEFTGRENIYVGGMCLGLRRSQIDKSIDDIIEFSELRDFIDQPFKTYSSGMQARLTFATATAVDPDILIIDEALSVGDARFQRKSFSRIERFKKLNKTILLVSHDVNTIAQFCDEVVLLEKGRVIMQGAPKTVLTKYHQLLFDDSDKNDIASEAARENIVQPNLRASCASTQNKPVTNSKLAALGRNGLPVIKHYSTGSYEPANRLSEIEIGLGLVTIIDAAILDESLVPVSILTAERKYNLWMRIRCHRNVESIVPGFVVRTVKGVDIYGWDSMWASQSSLINVKAKEEYDIVLSITNNLANGSYFLTLALADDNSNKMDVRYDLIQFSSLGTEHLFTTSVVNLGGKSSWQRSIDGA